MELYQVSVGTPDVVTGKTQQERTVYRLRRCITFDLTLQSVTEYNLSYLSANKNFSYGQEIEVGDRIIILTDLPDGVELRKDNYLVYNGQKYQPKKVIELDYKLGFMAHVRRTQGEKPQRIITRLVQTVLDVGQEVSHDKSQVE